MRTSRMFGFRKRVAKLLPDAELCVKVAKHNPLLCRHTGLKPLDSAPGVSRRRIDPTATEGTKLDRLIRH
jgi:hypothetical protein